MSARRPPLGLAGLTCLQGRRMRITIGRGAALAALLSCLAAPLAAQSGAFAGFGFGYGTAGMYASGRSDLKPGESVMARVGLERHGRPFLSAHLEYQLHKASIPGRQAEFNAFSALAGVQVFASSEFYLMPSVGWQFRSWNGDERLVDSESGPLASLGMGYHLRFGDRFSLAPEAVGRFGEAKDAGAGSFRAIGFRVIATWKLSAKH
jgi:hypothetical protein